MPHPASLPLRCVASVAEALSAPAGSELRVGGRVLAVQEAKRQVLLADATGQAVVYWPAGPLPLPSPGTLWLLLAHRRGPDEEPPMRIIEARQVGAPRHAFPEPEGEWIHFQERGAERAHWMRLRAEAAKRTRAFFETRGFLEVETPVAVYSPGVEPHLQAFALRHETSPGGARWLRTSPEYEMKRLLAAGFPRIFQLGPVFRRDELGPWHEPEFTLLEWYRSFAEMESVMEDTERLVAELAQHFQGRPMLQSPHGPVDVLPPWPRMSVDEAFRTHAGRSVWDVLPDEEAFFRLFVERVQPALGRSRPVFLVQWPASMASLARLSPEDPRVAERFEAFVGGIELCNGFGELVDPTEQRRRCQEEHALRARLGLPEHPVCERFLAALEEGLPPSAGNALGFDRLLALLAGATEIRDTKAVPSTRIAPRSHAQGGGGRRSE